MSAALERRRREHEERIAHRESLERQHGVVGHKRAERCYELAWEYGHSGGFEEVANYYIDLVELLSDVPTEWQGFPVVATREQRGAVIQ